MSHILKIHLGHCLWAWIKGSDGIFKAIPHMYEWIILGIHADEPKLILYILANLISLTGSSEREILLKKNNNSDCYVRMWSKFSFCWGEISFFFFFKCGLIVSRKYTTCTILILLELSHCLFPLLSSCHMHMLVPW